MGQVPEEMFSRVIHNLMDLGIENRPPEASFAKLADLDGFAKAMADFINGSPATGLWVLARLIGGVMAKQRGVVPEEMLQRVVFTCVGIMLNDALEGAPPQDEQRPAFVN